MPRGGKRPNSGPKRKILPEIPVDTRKSAVLLEALNRPKREDDSYEVQQWRRLTEARDINVRGLYRWRLFEHSEGRSIQTVNHLHDKPIEMNVTLSLATEIQKARQRAKERAEARK